MDGQIVSAKTQTDAAYAALREAILSCRLAPGAKIKISDAAAEFDFSPGAVREALSRLAAERMAVATAQKGFTVAAISAEELVDLTRTRIAIEQLCLRSSIAEGDVEWEAEILAAYHRLHRLPISLGPRENLSPAWAAAHNAFHAALASACGSRWTLTHARNALRAIRALPQPVEDRRFLARRRRRAQGPARRLSGARRRGRLRADGGASEPHDGDFARRAGVGRAIDDLKQAGKPPNNETGGNTWQESRV